MVELLVVIAIMAIALSVAIPDLQSFYRRHKLEAAARETQVFIRGIRLSALKEKNPYRIVFHDVSALNPNRVEIQKNVSGTYTTLQQGVHSLPDGVSILGSGSTNSLDNVVLSSRGICTAGKVYFYHAHAGVQSVDIKSTCQADLD